MSADVLRPWRPGAGDWNAAAAAHLWSRGGFGARPAELARALEEGHQRSIERLFDEGDDSELRRAVEALLAAQDLELLQAWWMSLILGGHAPLRERMALLWHDHFATSHAKVEDVRLMHAQNELFRRAGRGDFRALLRGVARDPAMLVWLDGNSNRKGNPNENFARELLELFALGIGNYDEHDVQELARAFTGAGTDGRTFAFRRDQHDAGEKEVFGQRGCFDGQQAIELVLTHPACARHIARTLLEGFVAPQPASAWIDELASVLVREDWHLGRTLRLLLGSELFFSADARGARIAGPVELVAVAARTLDAHVPPRKAARWCAAMGQALFRPPSVKGWDGGRNWIHTGTWIARHNALVELVSGTSDDSGATRVDLARLLPEHEPEPLARATLARVRPDLAHDEALRQLLESVAAASTMPETACVVSLLTSPEAQRL